MRAQAEELKRVWLTLPFSGKGLTRNLKSYCASLLLVWLAIIFYRFSPYYSDYLRPQTQIVLLSLAIGYTVFGLLFYLLVPSKHLPLSRGYIILQALRKIGPSYWRYFKDFSQASAYPKVKLEQQEKIAVLFLLVKLFFLPLMLNFLFGNYDYLQSNLTAASLATSLFSITGFNNILFPLLLAAFLFVDIAMFTFGYTFDTKFLNNKVKSVEPTLLGWVVCLICYPPFNGTLNDYTSWYANDSIFFFTPEFTFAMRVLIVLLIGVYTFASLALGAKASNLTNRGIVSRGPYRFVRHPAYATKNLVWWLTIIPVFSLAALFSAVVWSAIYYLRSITEERHLLRDPDYIAYCQKVRYRFIPGVW